MNPKWKRFHEFLNKINVSSQLSRKGHVLGKFRYPPRDPRGVPSTPPKFHRTITSGCHFVATYMRARELSFSFAYDDSGEKSFLIMKGGKRHPFIREERK